MDHVGRARAAWKGNDAFRLPPIEHRLIAQDAGRLRACRAPLCRMAEIRHFTKLGPLLGDRICARLAGAMNQQGNVALLARAIERFKDGRAIVIVAL